MCPFYGVKFMPFGKAILAGWTVLSRCDATERFGSGSTGEILRLLRSLRMTGGDSKKSISD